MSNPPHFAAGRGPVLTRRAALAGALQTLALLAACAKVPAPMLAKPTPPPGSRATPAPPGTSAPITGSSPAAAGAACIARLPAVVAPTPLPYPGATQEEPETGLHVTGPAHVLDLAAYRLEVTGKVERRLSLTFDELRCLPRTEAQVVLECPGLFFDPQKLAGTPMGSLLALAVPLAGAETIRLSAVDGYDRDFSLAEGQAPENFLAYELGGQPLPASHGFPLRAVLPGRVGSAWMKWLVRMEVG